MAKSLYSRQNEIFLNLLRRQRETQRLRQTDLALLLGRGQGTVSKVERGARRLDVIELRDWLSALEVDFMGFLSSLDAELRVQAVTQITRHRPGPAPQRAHRKDDEK